MFQRRSLFVVVAVVALWQPASQAQTSTLVGRSLFTLTTLTPTFTTGPLTLDPLTADLKVRLRRPTTALPLAWASDTTVRVSVIEIVDGAEFPSTSLFTGGIRTRRDTSEAPESSKSVSPQVSARLNLRSTFLMNGRQYLPLTRHGETALSTYAVRVEITLVRGTTAVIDLIDVTATTAPAPVIEYHRSVAFDSQIDAQDVSSDGVITVSSDPVSSTNLAAFAGNGNSGGGGGQLGATTYALNGSATAMTEQWDEVFGTDFAHSGYTLALGSDNAARDVVNTLAGAPNEHAFGVVVFNGVDQTTPVGTADFANGTGTSDTRTVTTAPGQWIVDSLYTWTTTPTMGADQTLQNTENVAASTGFRQSTQDGASGGAMSWTTLGNPWGHGAIAFRPIVSVALTGTITASVTESDIVTGGTTIILTVTDDTYVDNLAEIAYVGGQDASFAGTTSDTDITFALTGGSASTPAIGDLVVVTFCTGSVADRTLNISNTTPTAYTLIGAELYSNDTFDVNMRVAYRFMPDPAETVVRFVGGTGHAQDAGTYSIQVFRNVDTGTTLDVAAVTQAQADSNSRLVNPPAITPTTAGAWIGVSGCGAGGTLTADYTDPGDLNNWRTDGQADTNDSGVGSGYFQWTAAEYNHGAYTGGGTDTTNDSWASVVWALRPATDSAFDNQRDELRDGCDSAQAEGTGWDALKTTTMPVANVVRTSSTVVTVTAQAAASYDITAQETVTCTVPAGILAGAAAVVATPTFTIDTSGGAPAAPKRLLTLGAGD